jgi:hypothetical protein
MSIELALADAANNCAREGARALIVLRSGHRIDGKLKQESGGDLGTRHVIKDDGGWATFLVEEVAAVESHR